MLDVNALAALKQLKSDITESKEILTGRVKGSFSRFGFVICDQHDAEYFLSPVQMEKLIPGDQIEFERFEDAKGKSYAEATKLISSDFSQFVGQYVVKGNAHLATPDDNLVNRSFFVPPKERKGNNQDFVLCQLTRHPFPDGKGQAKILKVIGNKGSAFLEHEFTKLRFGIHEDFPLKASQQADSCKESFIADQSANRTNLTDIPFVTIDNPNSKDMDDAIWATETDTGFQLQIAIADPSTWISENSNLDIEARERTTSTYLPGQTVHMLPARMSQNLCSLVAGFDRLALVLDIQIATDGNIHGFDFKSAVVKSQGKLNYQQISDWLEKPETKTGFSQPVRQSLMTLEKVTGILNQRRIDQNLVMKNRDDFRFQLDDMGKILSIYKEPKLRARTLVEECMLLTNRLGAQYLSAHKTGMFITQPGLRKERLDDIKQIIAEDCPELTGVDPTVLEEFIKLINSSEENHADLRAILSKSFSRAEVSTNMTPHFAQGFEGYTTITSPIRRYLDLANHRKIHQIIKEKSAQPSDSILAARIQEKQSQSRQAGNIVENWLKCIYMENFEGIEFEAEVNFINGIGFGIRIPENGIEGFVNLKSLEPKTEFKNTRMQHIISDIHVKLGDRVRVMPNGADMERKQIQFNWLDHPGKSQK